MIYKIDCVLSLMNLLKLFASVLDTYKAIYDKLYSNNN